jgi:SAM-dependent methyltransferase
MGLDRSKGMLRRLQENLAQETPVVRDLISYEQGDMQSFDLGRQFRLITIPFRPFQHLLTAESQLACLDCIRRHLAPGGRFILDVFNPSVQTLAEEPSDKEFGHEPEFVMPDGRRVRRSARIPRRDLAAQINDVELIYSVTDPDGAERTLIHEFRMRYLFRFEVEHLLARAGLRIVELYADYDRSPFGSKYPGEIIAIAEAD